MSQGAVSAGRHGTAGLEVSLHRIRHGSVSSSVTYWLTNLSCTFMTSQQTILKYQFLCTNVIQSLIFICSKVSRTAAQTQMSVTSGIQLKSFKYSLLNRTIRCNIPVTSHVEHVTDRADRMKETISQQLKRLWKFTAPCIINEDLFKLISTNFY